MLFYVITENIKLNRRFFLIVLSIEETIMYLFFIGVSMKKKVSFKSVITFPDACI